MKQNMAVLLKTKINIAMVAAVILAILCWSYSTFRGYCLLYELHLVEQMDIWNYLLYNLNSAYNILFLYAFCIILLCRKFGIFAGYDILLAVNGGSMEKYWRSLLLTELLFAVGFAALATALHFLAGWVGGLTLSIRCTDVIDVGGIWAFRLVFRNLVCLVCYLFALLLLQNAVYLLVRQRVLRMLLVIAIPIGDMVLYKCALTGVLRYTMLGNVKIEFSGTSYPVFYWIPVVILLCILNFVLAERVEPYGEIHKVP